MPRSEVKPKSSVFEELCRETKQAAVAKKLGVAIGTLGQFLRGEMVSRGIIEYAAERMNRPVSELIAPRPERLIPDEAAFFESLKFGWYIDNDRRRSGAVCWYKEQVELHLDKDKKSRAGLPFTGNITNQFGESFEVDGGRFDKYHFLLTGVSKQHEWILNAAFSLRIDDVLCGAWSGINHLASNTAVYRVFLSANELTVTDLQRLARESRLECHDEAPEFGW